MSRRVLSAFLIALVMSGGGGLPVLDGLVFHSRDLAGQNLGSHYEAGDGCHADGCAVRSTAMHARFAPPGHVPTDILVESGRSVPVPVSSVAPSSYFPRQPHSRAPPSLPPV